jgi:hypothetical protein
MMGGGAFILFKAGVSRPESPEQAETGLADLSKILGIARYLGKKLLAKAAKHMQCLPWRGFRQIWLIGWNCAALLPKSQF